MGTGKLLGQYHAAESEAMAAEFERTEMTWRAAHRAEEPAGAAPRHSRASPSATRPDTRRLHTANRQATPRLEEAQCAMDKFWERLARSGRR